MHRKAGQHIQVTFLLGHQPVLVMPVTVVADRDDLIAHYLADGTRYLRREAIDGTPPPRVIPADAIGTVETRMLTGTWRGTHRLIVTRPDQAHAVFMKWTPSWEFIGWYVNLQEPLRRTEEGFETRDHFLDIQVAPDRTWRWKDEDELEESVGAGRLTRAEADAVRREGERVIPAIEAGRFPFDDSFIHWRPDTEWTIPHLFSDER